MTEKSGPFEGLHRRLAARTEEFPNKEEWRVAQTRALAALQAKSADRESPDILRVEYPDQAVTAEQGPVFDRPDPKRRPVILGHEFFSFDPTTIAKLRLEAWDGARSIQDELALAGQRRARPVSFIELETTMLRLVLREEREQRPLVLTGIVLRYGAKDWYPIVDFATDGRGEARVPSISRERGRFIRFCEADRLQALAQRAPGGHALIMVELKPTV